MIARFNSIMALGLLTREESREHPDIARRVVIATLRAYALFIAEGVVFTAVCVGWRMWL